MYESEIEYADATVRIHCYSHSKMFDEELAFYKAKEVYKQVKMAFGLTNAVEDDSKSVQDGEEYCLHLTCKHFKGISGTERETLRYGLFEALVHVEMQFYTDEVLRQEGVSLQIEVADFHKPAYDRIRQETMGDQLFLGYEDGVDYDIVADISIDVETFVADFGNDKSKEAIKDTAEFIKKSFDSALLGDFELRYNLSEENGWFCFVVGLDFKGETKGEQLFALMHFEDMWQDVLSKFQANQYVGCKYLMKDHVKPLKLMQHEGNETRN